MPGYSTQIPRRAGAVALVGVATVLLAGAGRTAHANYVVTPPFSATLPAKQGKTFHRLPIHELTEEEAIVHVLNRLAYGPRPGDIERVRQQGLENWIEQQLHPESVDDSEVESRLADFQTLRMSSGELLASFPTQAMAARRATAAERPAAGGRVQELLRRLRGPQRILAELSMARVLRAVYSQRQLQERMVDFWYNHFNVFAAKGADRWLVTSYERDVIRPHALGKFEDLLVATAKSPAMLFYLDNWMSVDPEAYARLQGEIELRRRQAMMIGACAGLLRPFGLPNPLALLRCEQALARRQNRAPNAPQRPAKNAPRGLNENYARELMELHTVGLHYTQADVTEMARCFTGWTIRQPRRNPEFFFDERLHSPGTKRVLGYTIDAGGIRDGERILHLLAHDRRTAQFISLKLARHFVMDDPPRSLVDRMAASFLTSGGDIRQVLRTMIYSPEFWSRRAYRAKVKTPFELVVSALRTSGAEVTTAASAVQWIARMGEPLYLCEPPNGYPDVASAWVSSSALLNRMNFAVLLGTGRLPGVRIDSEALVGPETVKDPQLALQHALSALLPGGVSDSTRTVLAKRLSDPEVLQAALDDPVRHVNTGLIVGLVLGSPEFQRE
jgi:uncharacterized protein (DUF1800 family)